VNGATVTKIIPNSAGPSVLARMDSPSRRRREKLRPLSAVARGLIMHSAIVAVEIPEREKEWITFLTMTKDAQNSGATTLLSENVWLIDIQKSPAAFAQFVDACVQKKLPYRVLAIEHEPRWLPAGFCPKTT
jgi:hypothetical protein